MSDQAYDGGKRADASGTTKWSQRGWNRNTVADMTATPDDKINVKASSDGHDCWITGMVALSSTVLACVDNTNKKIKLIDIESKDIVSEISLTGSPWDVAVAANNQLAVTVPDDTKIQFLTYNSSLSSLSMGDSVIVNGACRGIAYSKDRLAVTFTSPEKIEILSLQGKVIQPILVDMFGKSLFSMPDYITVDKDDTCIFVSDLQKDSITKLAFTGKVLDTYIDHELAGPEGLFFCGDGSLLVTGVKRNNVFVITPKNRKLKTLLNDKYVSDKPQAICFIDDSGLLILSNYRSNELSSFKVAIE